MSSAETESERSWESVLRKMLPPGAPLPDEDHLDYSIALEYDGPPIPYEVPKVSLAAPPKSEGDERSWESVLRRMLPPGAPMPDDESLDYSIAIEYDGPPVPHDVPKVEPLVVDSAPGVPIPKLPRFIRASSSGGEYRGMVASARNSSSSSSVSKAVPETESQQDSSPPEPVGPVLDRKAAAEGRRAAVVTFHTAMSEEWEKEDEEVEFSSFRSGVANSAPVASPGLRTLPAAARAPRKRGICSRCGKKNRLREKEACLVCDARYCSNCVLKAMGSMPEGRKCVSCIRHPIDESKRAGLGKCSRMLCRLLSPMEVRQIMKAEQECEANQLRPEQLVVNGRPLRQEELAEIMGCPLPPQKLRPGRYWYDKDSGLWGKEGEKPDRIISSKLNVGGKLKMEASNGNTQVYINGREITGIELRMLKVVCWIEWTAICSRVHLHMLMSKACYDFLEFELQSWVDTDGKYKVRGAVMFFSRISLLMDQNTQAVHMFMSALLQVFDTYGLLYGELASFVFQLLRIMPNLNKGQRLLPGAPSGTNVQGQNNTKWPKPASSSWDSIWGDGCSKEK